MAGELLFRCAVCGIEKKETNGWLMSWVKDGVVCFAHFDGRIALESHVTCLCGEAHCHTVLSQALPQISKPEDLTEEIEMEREEK